MWGASPSISLLLFLNQFSCALLLLCTLMVQSVFMQPDNCFLLITESLKQEEKLHWEWYLI